MPSIDLGPWDAANNASDLVVLMAGTYGCRLERTYRFIRWNILHEVEEYLEDGAKDLLYEAFGVWFTDYGDETRAVEREYFRRVDEWHERLRRDLSVELQGHLRPWWLMECFADRRDYWLHRGGNWTDVYAATRTVAAYVPGEVAACYRYRQEKRPGPRAPTLSKEIEEMSRAVGEQVAAVVRAVYHPAYGGKARPRGRLPPDAERLVRFLTDPSLDGGDEGVGGEELFILADVLEESCPFVDEQVCAALRTVPFVYGHWVLEYLARGLP